MKTAPHDHDRAPGRSASRVPGLGSLTLGVSAWLVLVSWAVLYIPTFWGLAQGIWAQEEHSYGPVILAAALWLAWQDRSGLVSDPRTQRPVLGFSLVALAWLLYAVGRALDIMTLELGSQLPFVAGLLLMFWGTAGLRRFWLPLVLLVFVVPLPADIVAAVTAPLKSAVSTVAAEVLHRLGYPIARSGVILTIGPYQLFVADACAGLSSIFTLEAMGIIYMRLAGHLDGLRNTLLALLLVPVAFSANVIRVIVLVLVTYHFGDAVAQSSVHSFAGILLFAVATLLMLGVDSALGMLPRFRPRTATESSRLTTRPA